MNPRHTDTDPIHRALLDVVHSVRGLIARTKGIQQLGMQEGDSMSPLVQRSRGLMRYLEQAVAEMAVFDDERSSLKIEREPSGQDSEKVVIRCIESVLESEGDEPRGAVGGRRTVDLRGTGHAVGIPELLSFFESIDKTGTLEVTTFDENFTVVLEEGEVVHACSDSTPPGLRLGDLLVAQGATTHAELQAFLREHGDEKRPLGELVVREGVVTREELEDALEMQIQQLFHRLFEARDATFCFYDGHTDGSKHGVHMNLTRLLLESCFEADERMRAATEE